MQTREQALTQVAEGAKSQFLFYESQHRAKNTPESNVKAKVNSDMADMMQSALDVPSFHDLAMRTAAPAGTWHPPESGEELISVCGFENALIDYIEASRELDRWKSRLIYGKEKDESKFDPMPDMGDEPDYSHLAGKDEMVHAVLGIATEGGELAEHLLWALNGRTLDMAGLVEETGDVDWFQELLAKFLGVSVDNARVDVIAKLMKRYPEKYTQDHAVARLDKEEVSG